MKPKKNRVFCRACNRHKMLFESKAKADNFIKFNREEIQSCSGRAPERSYFCAFCGGWHVTSCKSAVIGSHIDERDQKIIERLDTKRNGNEEIVKGTVIINQKIGTSKVLVYFGELDQCEKTVEECLGLLETLRDKYDVFPKYFEIRGKMEKYWEEIDVIRQVSAMSQEERGQILGIENPTKEEADLQEKIQGLQLVENFNVVKNSIEKIIEDGDYENAREIIASYEKEECKMVKKSPFNVIKNEIIRRLSKLVKKNNACIEREKKIERKRRMEEEREKNGMSETAQNVEKVAKVSEDDRKTMLEILQRIESAKVALGSGETGKCEDDIEVAYFLLEQLRRKDDNYLVLNAHVSLLAEEVGKMHHGVAA